MKKPDIKQAKKLIMEAPIGQYIGKEGAQILAERVRCLYTMNDSEFLFHQGDVDNCFYIVCEGRLALVKEKNKDKSPQVLHILEKGDLVGELSFIDETPHFVSVMALENASLLCFKAEDIKPLITEHPKLMFDFMRAIIKRVHYSVANISKQQLALSDYISSGGKGRS